MAVAEEENPLRQPGPTAVVPPAGAGGEEQPAREARPAPAVTVKVTGPARRRVGEAALFTIDLSNPGATPIHNVRVVDRYDPALHPDQATEGAQPEENAITWTIDLPPGSPTRLSIRCTCQTASARTCNRVTVVLPDGNRIEDEACLEILPAARPTPPEAPPGLLPAPATGSDLRLSVVGLHNPVKAGKELTYEIRAVNKGPVACQQVRVTATLPDGMSPVALGTVGPSGAKPHLEDQTVRFDPIDIAAGATVSYDVRVLAKQPGQRRFIAELSAPALIEPQRQETSTEVIEGQAQ
jgi:uncharacterized repeat protein (TIGR01451 family)